MAIFLYFFVAGIIMYFLDVLWLRLRGAIKLTSFLSSGCLAGITIGMALKTIYSLERTAWIVVPIITISGSFFLYLFARYKLYKNPFFRLFSTISLGIVTGLSSLIIFKLLITVIPSQNLFLSNSTNLLMELIVDSFTLHFCYAFSSRFYRKKAVDADDEKIKD